MARPTKAQQAEREQRKRKALALKARKEKRAKKLKNRATYQQRLARIAAEPARQAAAQAAQRIESARVEMEQTAYNAKMIIWKTQRLAELRAGAPFESLDDSFIWDFELKMEKGTAEYEAASLAHFAKLRIEHAANEIEWTHTESPEREAELEQQNVRSAREYQFNLERRQDHPPRPRI
jgi:hypothetical protein